MNSIWILAQAEAPSRITAEPVTEEATTTVRDSGVSPAAEEATILVRDSDVYPAAKESQGHFGYFYLILIGLVFVGFFLLFSVFSGAPRREA